MIRPATRPNKITRLTWAQLALVIALLLLMLVVRIHHIRVQEGFLDEGFHVERAELVWEFRINPGTISDGKLLLYYWLGLFNGPHIIGLYVSRFAVAILTPITGALIYAIGRRFHSHRTGVLALALYSFFPLVLMHERMAMADPMAAMFGCAIVLYTDVFARKPTLRNGALLGLLMATALMAKLTLIGFPLFVLVYLLLRFPTSQKNWFTAWQRTYLKPLIVAGIVCVVLWLPLLVPALLSRLAGTPYSLLDTDVVISQGQTPLEYVGGLIENLLDFTSPVFWLLMPVSFVVLFVVRKTQDSAELLLLWLASCLLPLVALASQSSPRYVVTTGPLFVLLIAMATITLIQQPRLILRGAGVLMAMVVAGWVALYMVPFAATLLTAPSHLNINPSNRWAILSPVTTSDATRLAGDSLASYNPTAKIIYADWTVCRLMIYSVVQRTHCLDRTDMISQLNKIVREDWHGEKEIYLFTSPFPFYADALDGACAELISVYSSGYQNVKTWAIRRTNCPPMTF